MIAHSARNHPLICAATAVTTAILACSRGIRAGIAVAISRRVAIAQLAAVSVINVHADAHTAWIQTVPGAAVGRQWRIGVGFPRLYRGIHIALPITVTGAMQNGHANDGSITS